MGILDFLKKMFSAGDEAGFVVKRGKKKRRVHARTKPIKKPKVKKVKKPIKPKPVKKPKIKAAPKKIIKPKPVLPKRPVLKPVIKPKLQPKPVIKQVKKEVKPVKTPVLKVVPEVKGKEIGEVTHFFDKISVVVIKLKAPLKVGYKIHIKGKVTDFAQPVVSMQINHKNVQSAAKGDDIGMKVIKPAQVGDTIYIDF